MKTKRKTKYLRVFLLLALPIFLAVLFVSFLPVSAACREGAMIYEIYGGGGNSGATYNSDYVVLYNSTPVDILLDGWLLQYASSNGLFTSEKSTPLAKTLPAKGYFLIEQGGKGFIGGDLPMIDRIGSINANLAADKGKVALVHSLVVVNSEDANLFDDFVAYSGGSNIKSVYRKNITCLDTDNYVVDFGTHAPAPKNSLTRESSDNVQGCKEKIIISEIFPFSGEFVEIKNEGKEKCDLAGWKISDQTNGKHDFPINSIIEPGKYFAFIEDFGLNSASPDGAKLFDPSSTLIEEKDYIKPPGENLSFSRDDTGEWSWTTKTPNEKNVFEKKDDSQKTYSDKIQITELFSNPFQAKYEEYIELYNGTSQDVDLLGWKLHDASKSGQYTFAVSTILQAKKYLAIFKKDFGFALNNSGAESVTLLDPNGKEVFSVSYEGSKQNRSDNFDGNDWHWSQFLTPGEENIFNSLPFGALEIDSDVFVNVAASFSISIGDSDGDKVSVTWDFGDGHKSYLVKTQHKYVKTGKYAGNVKLSDGSEDVVKDFEIEVQDYPHPKVRIVAINANPKGADSGVESLTIENQASKKVNLLGWSIATGWKKFINHPIKEDVIIKKNKTTEVTNEVASFTLNNTKAKIQLRYPDGKVAQEVKYKKTSEIGEGEIYRKVKGGWTWLAAKQDTKNLPTGQAGKIQETNNNQNSINNDQNTIDNSQNTINNEQGTINKIQETNNEQEKNTVTSSQPASSVDGSSVISNENRRKNKILTGEDENVKIELLKNQPVVLGAETVREVDGQYFFTPKIEQKHYLVSFWEKLLVNFNAGMNQVLNYFWR